MRSKKEKDRERIARLNRVKFLEDYKSKHPCVICGENRPVCLDFHHIDNNKKGSLSKLTKTSWVSIQREIEKCIVVCSNCHRIIHREENYATSKYKKIHGTSNTREKWLQKQTELFC
jgi:hypothetical protein